jgi:hypothetical protein
MNITSSDLIIIICVIILIIVIICISFFWSSFWPSGNGNKPVKKQSISSDNIAETLNQILKPIIANNNSGMLTISTKLDILSSKLDKQNFQLVEKDTKMKELDAKIKEYESKISELEAEISDCVSKVESQKSEIYQFEKTKNDLVESLKSDYERTIKQKDDEFEQRIKESEIRHASDSQKNLEIIDKNKQIHLLDFIKNTLLEDTDRIYNDVLLGNSEATSLWTCLASLKSSFTQGDSHEFTLQILKQFGQDLVKYYALWTDYSPQFMHKKLSIWADCLNANSGDRFILFIPALGSPINNSLMQSSSASACSVTEVLGWGIRNPNGIVYSTALIR